MQAHIALRLCPSVATRTVTKASLRTLFKAVPTPQSRQASYHIYKTTNKLSSTAAASSSPAALAGTSQFPRRVRGSPAEPWRCHFEFDDHTPTIWTFFDKTTSTWQYVVADVKEGQAVIIDPVLDYDPASGKVSTHTADGLLAFAHGKGLTITGIL